MTTRTITVQALAAALAEATAERGYIDLGAMDLAFGGGEPFREVAAAIFAALPAEPAPGHYEVRHASSGYDAEYKWTSGAGTVGAGDEAT